MAATALALMLAAAVAGFVFGNDGWFFWLFVAGLVAQAITVYNGVQRWRKAAK